MDWCCGRATQFDEFHEVKLAEKPEHPEVRKMKQTWEIAERRAAEEKRATAPASRYDLENAVENLQWALTHLGRKSGQDELKELVRMALARARAEREKA